MSEPVNRFPGRRHVRSFVRREGRLTRGQQRAIDALYPRFGVPDAAGLLDPGTAFGRRAPLVVDIGFGDGESLVRVARAHPERDYLGIEVYRPGIGRLLRRLEAEGPGNVRVIEGDAVEILRRRVVTASLAGVQLFFPDPWPKKRHHKRRIVQPAWLDLVATRLAAGGFLHMATDWADYAEQMMHLAGQARGFRNAHGPGRFADNPGERPETKFERRGLGRGHEVWDILLARRGAS